MATRKLTVEIVGDSRSLERALSNSTRATQRFSVGMGTIVKGAVGFLTVQKAAGLAGDAIRAGIDEFADAARVTAQTNAALRSTGSVANVTAGHVSKLAQSLLSVSGIDDELIQSGENLLLTFKNVRNEVGKGNAIFDRATKAAVDLSVAGFGSIETTAKQLGKALNDPVKGMTALGRAGVTFTDAQKATIKALVDSGNLLQAQKVLLREVESQVGGSARALGETLPGKLNRLRETFNNLAGDVIARFEPSIKKGADAVVDWLSKTKNQERIQRDIAAATKTVVGIVETFVGVLGDLRSVLEPVVQQLGGVKNAVKLLLAVFVASKVTSFAAAFTGLGTEASVAAGRVGALRLAMLRLGAIGVITLGVEVIINRREITKKLEGITDSLPGPHATVDLSKLDLKGLQEFRKKIEGFSGPLVKAVDDQIKKLQAKLNESPAPKKNTGARGIGAVIANALSAAQVQINKELSKGKLNAAASAKRFKDVFKTLSAAVTSAESTEGSTDDIAALRNLESSINAQIAATGKTADLVTKLASTRKKLAQTIKTAAKEAKESQQKAFAQTADLLGLSVDRDLARRNFDKALKDNTALQTAIRKQIGVEGKTPELERKLFEAQQDRRGIVTDQRQHAARQKEKTLAKLTAQQFKNLGLTAAGEARVPGIDNLRRQLGQISDKLGTEAAPKIRSQLSRIAKALRGDFGKVTVEIRKKIVDMFDTIRGTFTDEVRKGPLTKGSAFQLNKFLEGIALSPNVLRTLERRFTRFSPAGLGRIPVAGTAGTATQPFVIHTHVELDRQKVGQSVERVSQNKRRHNPPPRR